MAGQTTVTIQDRQWLASIASTYRELTTGLSGIPCLTMGTGIFFTMPGEQVVSVTTQEMLFPIDILFISGKFEVMEVVREVIPGMLVTSTRPVRYFLEVNAGEAEGITSGDEVLVGSVQAAEEESTLTSSLVSIAGLMMVGSFLMNMGKTMTGTLSGKKKPKLYGPKGEVLARTYRVQRELWYEIAGTIKAGLQKCPVLSETQCTHISQSVASAVEKRLQPLAWLELPDGTTFERNGHAKLAQGLRLRVITDYLDEHVTMSYRQRDRIAEKVCKKVQSADALTLRDGTVFRKAYTPGLPRIRNTGDHAGLLLPHASFSRNGIRWFSSSSGREVTAEVTGIKGLSEWRVQDAFSVSTAKVSNPAENATLPFAGVSGSSIWWLATVAGKTVELEVRGIKGLSEVQVEDAFADSVAMINPHGISQTGKPARNDVKINTWAERDRVGIWLTDTRTGKTVAEWWDKEATRMFDQGWFAPGDIRHQSISGRRFEESVLEYAESVGILAGKVTKVIPLKPQKKGDVEYLPDSPEFLAYTIEDIGYRDKIDHAFLQAIRRAQQRR